MDRGWREAGEGCLSKGGGTQWGMRADIEGTYGRDTTSYCYSCLSILKFIFKLNRSLTLPGFTVV